MVNSRWQRMKFGETSESDFWETDIKAEVPLDDFFSRNGAICGRWSVKDRENPITEKELLIALDKIDQLKSLDLEEPRRFLSRFLVEVIDHQKQPSNIKAQIKKVRQLMKLLDARELGKKVRAIREAAGLSLEEAAELFFGKTNAKTVKLQQILEAGTNASLLKPKLVRHINLVIEAIKDEFLSGEIDTFDNPESLILPGQNGGATG